MSAWSDAQQVGFHEDAPPAAVSGVAVWSVGSGVTAQKKEKTAGPEVAPPPPGLWVGDVRVPLPGVPVVVAWPPLWGWRARVQWEFVEEANVQQADAPGEDVTSLAVAAQEAPEGAPLAWEHGEQRDAFRALG